jgi:hypothetical protein
MPISPGYLKKPTNQLIILTKYNTNPSKGIIAEQEPKRI